MNYDAIIVLAGGMKASGELSDSSIRRVKKAISLFNLGLSKIVIMSGKQTLLRNDAPTLSEAEAMAAYAADAGIPASAILIEKKSSNTLSNLYFVNRDFLMPRNFQKIILVTSDYHLKRVKYITSKFLGKDVIVRFEVASSKKANLISFKRVINEFISLGLARQYLAAIKDGDHKMIDHLFRSSNGFEISPTYAILNSLTRNRKQNKLEMLIYNLCIKYF